MYDTVQKAVCVNVSASRSQYHVAPRHLDLSTIPHRPSQAHCLLWQIINLAGSTRWKKPHKPGSQVAQRLTGVLPTACYSTFHCVRPMQRAQQRTSRYGSRTCRRPALEQCSEWVGTTRPELYDCALLRRRV